MLLVAFAPALAAFDAQHVELAVDVAEDEIGSVARAYSITSSARASKVGGISKASAFAVLRLITSSNLVGCSIGRSAGLVPPLHLAVPEVAKIVQSSDCAAKSGELNDYSVCLTSLVHKNEFYLVDVLRQRPSYPELKKKVFEQKTRFKADVGLIEDTGHGTALIQDLRGSRLHAVGRRPEKDKITRISAQSAKIEAGQLLLPAQRLGLKNSRRRSLAVFGLGR